MDGLAAFLKARLDEDEAAAKKDQDAPEGALRYSDIDEWGSPLAWLMTSDRVLREVSTWRRLLSEYSIPPGMDAKYGGTERETGFRLALSLALKCKAAEYYGHPDYDPGRWPSVLV